MTIDGYKFVTLYDRSDLLLSSGKFLNQEWPRSDGSREHSQRKSCRPSPPMSFLLLQTSSSPASADDDPIIGHARICLLPNRPKSVWIESVMIHKLFRGQKLGKLLMFQLEQWLIQNGFDEAFLSTDDQINFYKSCGFIECSPIVHSTTSTSVFPAMSHFHSIATVDHHCSTNSIPSAPTLSTPPPPPPPPPPPLPLPTSPINQYHQYMKKSFNK